MSIIHIDGFDVYQQVGGAISSSLLAGTGYSLFSNGGGMPITAANGVTAGSTCIQFERAGGFYSNMAFAFASDADKVVVGFAFKGDNRAPIFDINDISVVWEDDGPLSVEGVSGEHVIVLGRWYYLEVELDRTADEVNLYVNDTLYATAPLPVPARTDSSWTAEFGWQSSGASALLAFDDLLICDSAVASDGIVGRMGPVEHRALPALEAVTQDFDNPTSKTPVEVVGSIPPNEGVFLESDQSGAKSFYRNADFADDRPVLALTVVGVVSKTDLDNRQMALAIEDTNSMQEEVFDVGLTFAYKQASFTADSAGAPWTKSSIISSQWGAVVRP